MSWYPKYWRDDRIIVRYVYALFDSNSDKLYIGHTNNFKRRYYEHTSAIDLNKSKKYIEWLEEVALKPKMIILESDDLALYEVTQLESAWIRATILQGYDVVNSTRDIERGLNTFSGVEDLAEARRNSFEYIKEIKNSEGKLFFLPTDYIDGVAGAYASGMDSSIIRRIETREVMEELIHDYKQKGDMEMVNILQYDYEDTQEYYEKRNKG